MRPNLERKIAQKHKSMPKKHRPMGEERTGLQVFALDVIKARHEFKWTQKELADKANCSRNTIGNVERAFSGSKTTCDLIRKAIDDEFFKRCGKPYLWTDPNSSSKRDQIIDIKSLSEFIRGSELVTRIDNAVSTSVKLKDIGSDDFVKIFARRLRYLKIGTLLELETKLEKQEQFVTRFCICYFRKQPERVVPKGIGISFLGWSITLGKSGLAGLKTFLEAHRFDQNLDPDKLSQQLYAAYKEALRELRIKEARR